MIERTKLYSVPDLKYRGRPDENAVPIRMSKIDRKAIRITLREESAGAGMNVHLTKELEQLVHSWVQSGRYGSASEVVREALRLLADRDEMLELRKAEIRKKIARGMNSLARNEGADGETFFVELEREEREIEKGTA